MAADNDAAKRLRARLYESESVLLDEALAAERLHGYEHGWADGVVERKATVERLTKALHRLHSPELWEWWEAQPSGGAFVRSGTSPDFAEAIVAELDRLDADAAADR